MVIMETSLYNTHSIHLPSHHCLGSFSKCSNSENSSLVSHDRPHASYFAFWKPTQKSGCAKDCSSAYKQEAKPCHALKKPGQMAEHGACMEHARQAKAACKKSCQHENTANFSLPKHPKGMHHHSAHHNSDHDTEFGAFF